AAAFCAVFGERRWESTRRRRNVSRAQRSKSACTASGTRVTVIPRRNNSIVRGSLALANFAIADNVIVIERRSAMPTRNISLTREQDAFIEKTVKSGEYQNASEAVRDALRALQQRRREDTLRLKAVRVQIKRGVDALKRGEFTEVADADLDRYLETLTATAGRQAR